VARRRDQPDPGEQVELAVDRHVLHARRVDPRGDGVAVQAAGVVEFAALHVNGLPCEEVVPAAVVGVEVRVDDDIDAGDIDALLVQRVESRTESLHHRRVQLGHPGVDQDAGIRMVDDMDAEGHDLAFDVQVSDMNRRDGDTRHSVRGGRDGDEPRSGLQNDKGALAPLSLQPQNKWPLTRAE